MYRLPFGISIRVHIATITLLIMILRWRRNKNFVTYDKRKNHNGEVQSLYESFYKVKIIENFTDFK